MTRNAKTLKKNKRMNDILALLSGGYRASHLCLPLGSALFSPSKLAASGTSFLLRPV